MKKSAIVIFVFIFLIFSCKSVNSSVPGQKKIQINNLYAEYYNIADSYYSLKNYSKAITYYTLCLENKDLYNASYYKLGLSYAMNKDWNNAQKVFSDIYKKDPQNDSIKSSLAYVYSMNGETKKAEELYFEITQSQTESCEYQENYIAILIQNEKYDLAEKQFSLLKEKFPNSTKITDIEKKLATLNTKKETSTEDARIENDTVTETKE